MTEPCDLSARAAAAQIASGRLTSEKLVESCLARIAERESQVHAWAFLDPEQALAAARARDRTGVRGLLHGLPVGVKDIIETAAMPTGYGSPIHEGFRPASDAACVTLIERAGAVALGKTVTTEFAYFTPGKTRNPHNTAHTPGGSSSGSAAAVGDRMVPLAFGTQTVGSIIRPASYCGVVGYKPSYGSFPTTGIRPFAPALDTLGGMAREVGDIRLLRRALMGAGAPPPGPLDGLPTLAFCHTPWWGEARPESMQSLELAVEAAAAAGARPEKIELPDETAALSDVHQAILAHEAARSYGWEHAHRRDQMSPRLAGLVEEGWRVEHAPYQAALAAVAEERADISHMLAQYDAVIVPAAPGEAPEGMPTGDPVFSRVWTLLHVPCITIPCHEGPRGLPVGIQLVGRIGGDDRVLAVAEWLEGVLGRR
jgi:Asp-tRNA(Asn)/Glu-tRNA(Gln) amidotransferase A subunit family amidase